MVINALSMICTTYKSTLPASSSLENESIDSEELDDDGTRLDRDIVVIYPNTINNLGYHNPRRDEMIIHVQHPVNIIYVLMVLDFETYTGLFILGYIYIYIYIYILF